jgi:hypothetical protein
VVGEEELRIREEWRQEAPGVLSAVGKKALRNCQVSISNKCSISPLILDPSSFSIICRNVAVFRLPPVEI